MGTYSHPPNSLTQVPTHSPSLHMRLNLPILEHLADCKNILVAGMGGGFDVFCGLPVFFELLGRGQAVHLANLSFSETALRRLKNAKKLTDSLIGVTANHSGVFPSFPE